MKFEICFGKDTKIFLEKEKMLVTKGENAPFSTMFSKGAIFRVVKSRDCVVKD